MKQYVWGFDNSDIDYEVASGYEMFDSEADARVAAERAIQRFSPRDEPKTFLIGVLQNKVLVEIKKITRYGAN